MQGLNQIRRAGFHVRREREFTGGIGADRTESIHAPAKLN
jgi:hypothetical protein